MQKLKMISLCVGVAAGLLPAAHAQESVEQKKKYASSEIEEVTVTARKTEENLQFVPLAIKPIGSEAIESKAIQNLEDIANMTPGLNYSGGFSSGAQSSATIRGLAQGFVQDRTQNVAVFLDGIYLQRQSMANVGLIDMQRIEVVKGPQSALYGRNAFSGAINYVTKKPTDEAEGYVGTTQGSDGREDYTIRAAGPIIEDKLLGSWTYGTQLYDGHTDNDHPFAKVNPAGFSDGGSDGKLGGWDNDTYNIALIFRANENLELSAGFNHSDMNYETQPSYIIGGARETAKFGTTPWIDMNGNPVRITTVQSDNSGDTGDYVYGNTMWFGRLPTAIPRGAPAGWNNYGASASLGCTDGDPNTPCTYDDNNPANKTSEFGYGPGVVPADPRRPGTLSDPRNVGSIAGTDIITFGADWTINDSWSAKYLFGHIDHNGYTGGVAERDPLYGNFAYNVNPSGNYMTSNTFSARPVVDTKAVSHEARFEWAGNDLVKGSFGFYYGNTEDSQYDQTTYAGICTTPELNVDNGLNLAGPSNDSFYPGQDPSAACYQAVDPNGPSPYDVAIFPGITKFFAQYWSGAEANSTAFQDHIRSAYATLDYQLTTDLTLRLEGRFTQEDRRIERISDQFGLGAGQIATIPSPSFPALPDTNVASGLCAPGTTTITYDKDGNRTVDPDEPPVPCIQVKDSDRTEYFSPRIGLNWTVTDDHFLYTSLAQGVKAGGFNNTASPEQQRYEEESNWTFEIGSKNTLLDGALTLNAAVYYVDWTDVQGSEAPKGDNAGPNANVVIGNTSGITNLGYEIDGVWNLTEEFYVDFGYAYSDPKYDDDATFDAARRYYFYQCGAEYGNLETNEAGELLPTSGDGLIDAAAGEFNPGGRGAGDEILCGNDDIGGNNLPRSSKESLNIGLNYVIDVVDGWTLTSRLDGNYQSKQYVDQLNTSWIPSRTLYNASVKLQAPEHWEFIVWGKNVTDKEYISSAFVLALFNKNIVSYGAGESYGLTAKYNF